MKKIILTILILAFAIGLFILFNSDKKEIEPEKVVVNTEILKPVEYNLAGIYQGVLISRKSVFILPQTSGHIVEINAKAGDRVKKGNCFL